MSARLEVFVVTKGHAFSRDGFEAMLRAAGVEPTMVDQPAAAMLLNPAALRRFDAILFYDMPGMDFRAPVDCRPEAVPPDPAMVAGFEALLEQGKGIVALHHALAGWPAWPAYAEALGGAFLYKPRRVRGLDRPSSGYLGDVAYTVKSEPIDHPVLKNVPATFDLMDEPYLHEIFHDDIVPLLRRDTTLQPDRFHAAVHAVRRVPETERSGWTPPPTSDVIAWAKVAGNSPLVYIQPGDGPETYAHPAFRTLIGNALRWVASAEGAAWARPRR